MQDGFLWRFALLSLVVQVITELLQRFGWQRYTLPTAVVVGILVAWTTGTGLLGASGRVSRPSGWTFYVVRPRRWRMGDRPPEEAHAVTGQRQRQRRLMSGRGHSNRRLTDLAQSSGGSAVLSDNFPCGGRQKNR